MADLTDIPRLDSPARCATLWAKYPGKVVGLWALGLPRQNVDVLWRLRRELMALGVPVVFFFQESAKPLLLPLLEAAPPDATGDIYQLDDARFFRLLGFVEVLTTTYGVSFQDHHFIPAKLVSIASVVNMVNPSIWNYYYDYIISEKDPRVAFNHKNIDNCRVDYSLYPDACKLHRNSHLTQLMGGYPKIDLLAEERQKNAVCLSVSVLLLYPTYLDYCMTLQHIAPDRQGELWEDAVAAFLAWRPDGIAVFRPKTEDLKHPVVERLKARFEDEGRFVVDAELDNKFWLARADYFVTDYSEAWSNFTMSATRPSIRMIYTPEEKAPFQNEYGWTISRPGQLVPLLEKMDMDAEIWKESLLETRQREMPAFGRSFALIAGMIKRIYNNDDDPEWHVQPKGHTPCSSPADLLKLVAKVTRRSGFDLYCLRIWLNDVLRAARGSTTPGVWLLLLRRALLHWPDHDIVPEVVRRVDSCLANTATGLPFAQSVGVLRHCMRKDAGKCSRTLLMTITHSRVSGSQKKRALFLLLMELPRYDSAQLARINALADEMPQHFSRPVLEKLNRWLPLAMKVPLPLRRFAARLLGLKKSLARSYWHAHRALS